MEMSSPARSGPTQPGAVEPGALEPTAVAHRTMAQIEAGLAGVEASPRSVGRLELVVRRPSVDAREVLEEAELDLTVGLVGDSWDQRPSSRTDDSTPHPDMQLNVINSRFVELIAGSDRDAWALAGDQLYVDLDVSAASLPAGSRVALGDHAVIEVTDQPHTGCAKFAARFGRTRTRWCGPRRAHGCGCAGSTPRSSSRARSAPATPSACCRPTH